jgi:hypothetical protein
MNFTAAFIGVKGYELIEQLTGKGMPSDTAYGFLNSSLDSVVRGLQKLDMTTLMRADSDTQTSSLLGQIRVASLADRSGISNDLACRSLRTIIHSVFDFLRASEPRVATPSRRRAGITATLPALTRRRSN